MSRVLILVFILLIASIEASEAPRIQKAFDKLEARLDLSRILANEPYALLTKKGLSASSTYPIEVNSTPVGRVCVLENNVHGSGLQLESLQGFVDTQSSELTEVQHTLYERSRRRNDKPKVSRVVLSSSSRVRSIECFESSNMGVTFTAPRSSTLRKLLESL